MRSHELDYEIIGDDLQIVEVELDPNETVIAEAGAMNYMEADIEFEAEMGDGTNPNAGVMEKLLSVGKRALTGESLFLTHFTNRGSGKKRVAFAAPYPGKIVAMDLDEVGGGGGTHLSEGRISCRGLGHRSDPCVQQAAGCGILRGGGIHSSEAAG